MANYLKAEIMQAVRIMAYDMGTSWDTPAAWSDVSDALADLVSEIGQDLAPVHLATLLSAAALALRQSRKAEGTEVANARK